MYGRKGVAWGVAWGSCKKAVMMSRMIIRMMLEILRLDLLLGTMTDTRETGVSKVLCRIIGKTFLVELALEEL